MSTGRSPYPSRSSNRRRSSLEAAAAAHPSPSGAAAAAARTSLSPPPPTFSPVNTRTAGGGSMLQQNRNTTTNSNNNRRFFPETTEPTNKTTTTTTTTTMNGGATTTMDNIPVGQLRVLSKNCMSSSSTNMAVFYASIVYSKTKSTQDCLLYGEALYLNGEFRRCVKLLQPLLLLSQQQDNNQNAQQIQAILLSVQSLASLQEWTEMMELFDTTMPMMDDNNDEETTSSTGTSWKAATSSSNLDATMTSIHPLSLLCWWRGRAYDELSHPGRACVFWKRALQLDPKNVQAMHSLMDRNLLSAHEAYDLIMSLNMNTNQDGSWLRDLYLARVDVQQQQQTHQQHHHVQDTNTTTTTTTQPFRVDASSIFRQTPSTNTTTTMPMDMDENNQKMPAATTTNATANSPTSIQNAVNDAFDRLWTVHKLQDSPEALAVAATRSYNRHDLQQALYYCQQLYNMDPLCPQASLVHVATLLALNQKRILFGLAHAWVEASPKLARSWFAVGAYYYSCGRYHAAQRHFCRATRLDPQCTEAWIAFGCAFAACDESDQALATFRAAQRLAPAQHVPLLYMGMEYLRTNHLVLAQHFLTSAYKASGGDPLCLHELGVAAYQRCDYDAAIVWLTRALQAVIGTRTSQGSLHEAIDACQDAFWEPTLFNLGHCYRRTRQFVEAAYCFEKCLALCPGKASSFTALGFTKHLQGDTDGAIELYHQALSRKPDDPLSSEMLNRALQEALSVKMTVEDDDDVAKPPFRSPAPGNPMTFRSDKKRRSVGGGNMSMASEGSPSMSLMDHSDDVDMSLS